MFHTEFIQIQVSCPNLSLAKTIADQLVTNKLAGCVQISPTVLSIYHWQEQVESTDEVLLLIKAKAAKFSQIIELVTQLHCYDIPEIIAVPITHLSDSYRDWLSNNS